MLELRDRQRADAARDEQLPRVAQVARQEDDDPDLRELRGLEGQRAEVDPEVGAVDLRADARDARQQQEQQAAGGDQIAVALQRPVVAQQQDREREEREPDDEPLRLLAGQVVVDAVDHDQPDAGQHGDDREEVRIGVRDARADDEMRGQAEREEHEAVGQRCVGDLIALLDEDGSEAGHHQQRRRQQAEELAVASAHCVPTLPSSNCRTRSSASSRERSSWAVTVVRWRPVSWAPLTPDV